MRRGFKVLLWVVLGPVGLLLLLAAAWVVSNGRWADVAPRPVPAELQQRRVTLAAERNGFYDLQGLDAPHGESPNAWGQRSHREPAADQAGRLAWPNDPLWNCRSEQRDCIDAWRAEPERMSALLASVKELGDRCEALSGALGIEEVPPTRAVSGPDALKPWVTLPLPRFANLSHCLRWFGMRAALAAEPAEAQAMLARADRLSLMVLQGARSLIGTQLGASAVRRNWLLAADLAVRQPAEHRAGLLALLEPLPQAALSPRAWVPYELNFQREIMRDLVDRERQCAGERAHGSWLDRMTCRWQVGLLPEQTVQDNEDRWLARLATVPATGPASCEALGGAAWVARPESWGWRNTVGRILLNVADGQWQSNAARQIDLELLRQTLRAKVLGESVPSAVTLTRDDGAQRFAACQARLYPGDAEATLRLPLL